MQFVEYAGMTSDQLRKRLAWTHDNRRFYTETDWCSRVAALHFEIQIAERCEGKS